MKKDLTIFDNTLKRLLPNWRSGAVADSVPGSGLGYIGKIAYILTTDRVVILSPEKIEAEVFYDTIVRVHDIEFKGLIVERDNILVAPNETAGIEVVYKGITSHFERTIKVLTYSANHARQLVECTASAITEFLDKEDRDGGLTYRETKK